VYAQGSVLAKGFPQPVPDVALHPDATSQAPGLKAEYFDNTELQGTPKLTRTDAPVKFDWRHSSPLPGLAGDHFSVRWSGTIAFPVAGEYNLKLAASRGAAPLTISPGLGPRAKFYLDGKLLPLSSTTASQVSVTVNDSKPHALRIDYVRTDVDEPVNLQWELPNAMLVNEAVQKASTADVVFAFVGLSPQLEGEEMNVHIPGFDGGDKTDISLPATQQEMLEALKKTGKPLVVVLNSGSAIALNWAEKNADAVLQEWYPGEEGGDALANIVAGDVSPSGRLPVTFYRSNDELPAFTDYSMKNRTYRYFKGPVLYPFGYGLSYAKFHYGEPKLSTNSLAAGETLTATVEVKNESGREADEVVEAYLQAPQTEVTPRLFLVGFTRVHLAAGETRPVSLAIDARRMSEVDAAGKRAVVPGRYVLSIGGGQPGTGAAGTRASYEITGTKPLPE
jgi:beta-glucosidase